MAKLLRQLSLLALCALPLLALGNENSRISVLSGQGGSDPELQVNSLRLLAAPSAMQVILAWTFTDCTSKTNKASASNTAAWA